MVVELLMLHTLRLTPVRASVLGEHAVENPLMIVTPSQRGELDFTQHLLQSNGY